MHSGFFFQVIHFSEHEHTSLVPFKTTMNGVKQPDARNTMPLKDPSNLDSALFILRKSSVRLLQFKLCGEKELKIMRSMGFNHTAAIFISMRLKSFVCIIVKRLEARARGSKGCKIYCFHQYGRRVIKATI